MAHPTLSRETEDLLDRKNVLLSSFTSSERRIDHKISKLEKTFAASPAPRTHDHLDQLFEAAVERAANPPQNEGGIIGYHTEEILGVEEALARLKAEEAASQSPDLGEVESLLNQAEDIVDTMPKNRYMAARAAVDKMVLDNNPLNPKKEKTADSLYDALFSDDGRTDWEALPEIQTASVTPEDEDFFEAELTENDKNNVAAQPFAAGLSSKASFLLLFLSLIGLSVFLLILSPVIGRLDYLVLLVLAIFMVLTLDMSFNSVLVAAGVILLAYLAGYVREILMGFAQADFFHLGWFVFIPLCLISASAFVQKVYPRRPDRREDKDAE